MVCDFILTGCSFHCEPFVWYKLFQYVFELPVWTHGLIHFHFQEQNISSTQKCLEKLHTRKTLKSLQVPGVGNAAGLQDVQSIWKPIVYFI